MGQRYIESDPHINTIPSESDHSWPIEINVAA